MTARPSLLYCGARSAGAESLRRSLPLLRGLLRRFDVTFVTSAPLPRWQLGAEGINVVRVDDRRSLAGGGLAVRQRALVDVYRTLRPRVLLVERLPFGPSVWLPEIEPLLSEARSGRLAETLVCGSLRHDLGVADAAPADPAATSLDRLVDAVLVHSDPAFGRLDEAPMPEVPVFYTGFVPDHVEPLNASHRLRPGTIVVSGNGLSSERFMRVAIDAHARLPRCDWPPLTVVAGPRFPEAAWRRLQTHAATRPGVQVRRSVTPRAAELQRAAGSVSDASYSTVVDLLRSRVPALVVPGGDRGESQMGRARRLEMMGAVRVLPPRELSARRLAAEMMALRDFAPSCSACDFGGAERSARILETLCQSGVHRQIGGHAPVEEVVK